MNIEKGYTKSLEIFTSGACNGPWTFLLARERKWTLEILLLNFLSFPSALNPPITPYEHTFLREIMK